MSESAGGPSHEQQIYWQEFVQLKADTFYVRDYRNEYIPHGLAKREDIFERAQSEAAGFFSARYGSMEEWEGLCRQMGK
jgi:hypothetical protein